jgi:hypothetical protein
MYFKDFIENINPFLALPLQASRSFESESSLKDTLSFLARPQPQFQAKLCPLRYMPHTFYLLSPTEALRCGPLLLSPPGQEI